MCLLTIYVSVADGRRSLIMDGHLELLGQLLSTLRCDERKNLPQFVSSGPATPPMVDGSLADPPQSIGEARRE